MSDLVWEYIPEIDKLKTHVTDDGEHTRCHKNTWSEETDKEVDPDGTVWELIWYSDHDRPEDLVECEECK